MPAVERLPLLQDAYSFCLKDSIGLLAPPVTMEFSRRLSRVGVTYEKAMEIIREHQDEKIQPSKYEKADWLDFL